VRVLAAQERRLGRAAQGVRDEASLEGHAPFHQPLAQLGHLRYRVRRLIVGQDEEYIGALAGGVLLRSVGDGDAEADGE
jgi:hypothetical protein